MPSAGYCARTAGSGRCRNRTDTGASHALPDLARRQLPAAGLADRPRAAGGPVPAAGAGPRAVAGRPRSSSSRPSDDATLLAIADQEHAGLDIITDGEIRRESYSNAFATALDGIDIDNPGTALDRSGHPNPVPRIVGPIRRRHPVGVDGLRVPARAHRRETVKVTVPGPFTMAQQAQNDYYPTARGGRPRLRRGGQRARSATCSPPARTSSSSTSPTCRPARGRRAQYGVSRAQPGAGRRSPGTTAVHLCFGYAAIIHERPSGYSFLPELAALPRPTRSRSRPRSPASTARCSPSCDGKTIILGVLDLGDPAVETAETGRRPGPPGAALRPGRADRARARLRHEVPPARVSVRQADRDDPGRVGTARGSRRMILNARHRKTWHWLVAAGVRHRKTWHWLVAAGAGTGSLGTGWSLPGPGTGRPGTGWSAAGQCPPGRLSG